MTAFDQANARLSVLSYTLPQDIIDPGSGRVDQRARLDGFTTACQLVLKINAPMIAVSARSDDFCPDSDICAARFRIHGVENDEARVINPAIGVLKGAREFTFERGTRRRSREIYLMRCRQYFAPTQMVIEKEANPDQPSRPECCVVREHKTQWPDYVRRHRKENFALLQRFAHHSEFIVFEIAQSSVHEFCRG